MRNNMCVYLHLDDKGVIRYVGSGTKTRPYEKKDRNSKWHEVFKESPPNVVIVENSLSYDDAISLENYMYHSCKHTTVNISEPHPVLDLNQYKEELSDLFYVDSSSKSGLRLKKKLRQNTVTNVGDEVGCVTKYNNGKQYWAVKLKNKTILAHRVVYLLLHGTINKEKVINHIDGNGLNNHPDNLEEVLHWENSIKKSKRSDNKTGISGISYTYYKGKVDGFIARIKFGSNHDYCQRFSFRCFGDEASALAAAKRWRMYMLHVSKVEPCSDFNTLKSCVYQDLLQIKKVRCNIRPYQLKNGTWYCRITLHKNEPKVTLKGFVSKEECEKARDQFIEDYNSKLTATFPIE